MTKDPRRGTLRLCYLCGEERARVGQTGFCGPTCRFWSNVDRNTLTADGCWQWLGAQHSRKGYGRFDADGVRWLAHRYAYTLLVDPIPADLELDHRCQNTRCVNPGHLDPVTSEVHDNERSSPGAYNRRKTACPKGHEYSEENTRTDGSGRRHCRSCDKERRRA